MKQEAFQEPRLSKKCVIIWKVIPFQEEKNGIEEPVFQWFHYKIVLFKRNEVLSAAE